MAIKANIIIDQGTDFTRSFDIIDDNGQIVDLARYSGISEMRKHYSSSNGYAFAVDITPETGVITLTMNNAITDSITAGRYVYDVELTDSANLVSRVVEGIVTVTPRVRKSNV